MPALSLMRLFALLSSRLLVVEANEEPSAQQVVARQLLSRRKLTSQGTCADFTCPPPQYRQKFDASQILCGMSGAVGCSKTLCCLCATTTPMTTTTSRTCASWDCVAPRFRPKFNPAPNQVICPLSGCSNTLCCLCKTTTPMTTTTRLTCQDFTCPYGWDRKPYPEDISCPPGGCTDPHECCYEPTTTPRPTTTPCSTTTRPPASCSPPGRVPFRCPSNMVLKPNAANIPCYTPYSSEWPTCPGGEGREMCCDKVTTTPCSTTTPKPATCATPTVFDCGAGYLLRPKPENIFCHLPQGCNKYDRDLCCLQLTTTPCSTTTPPPATCVNYNCYEFPNYHPRPNPAQIKCSHYSYCNAEDKDLCCLLKTTTPAPVTCKTLQCPYGMDPRPNKDSIFCADPKRCYPKECCLLKTTTPCSTTLRSTTTPCSTTTRPSTCTSFICPSGSTLKPDADQIVCSLPGSSPCPPGDASRCCNPKTTTPCTTTTLIYSCLQYMRCPTGTKLRPGAENIMCDGPCDRDDEPKCCACLGTTLGPTPPTPATCLQPITSVGPYQCPSHMSLRPDMGRIACANPNGCGPDDMDICCICKTSTPPPSTTQPRISCSSFRCASGSTLRPDAGNIYCQTRGSCTIQDENRCCILMTTSTSTPPPSTSKGTDPCDVPDKFSTTGLFGLSRQERIIGGAVLGGGVVLGGTIGAITGGVLHHQKMEEAKRLCATELLHDLTPGSTVLEFKNEKCFSQGDQIIIGNNKLGEQVLRTVVGFSSIIVDKPIIGFLKAGTPVQKNLLSDGSTAVIPPTVVAPSVAFEGRQVTVTEAPGASGSSGDSANSLNNFSGSQGSMPGSWGTVTAVLVGMAVIACLALVMGMIMHMMHTKKKRGVSKVAVSKHSRDLRAEGDRLIVHDQEAQESPRYAASETSSQYSPAYYQTPQFHGYQPAAQPQVAPFQYAQEPMYAQAWPPPVPQPQWPLMGQNNLYAAPPIEGQMVSIGASAPLPGYGAGHAGGMPTYVEAGLFNQGGAQWRIE